MAQWFENFFDGLYARVLPATFDKSRTGEQVNIVKNLLKLRKNYKILDIPCGMGRLTIPMAQLGLHMTGVDLTPYYIEKARRQAKKEKLNIRFINCDMRDIDFACEFDAVFNWFGSFGYFSDSDNLRFCRRVFRGIKPGGRFLVEGLNKSWLLSHFLPHKEHLIAGVRIITRNKWSPGTNRVNSCWSFYKGRIKERCRISMRIFNGAEIRSLLLAAGFRQIKLYGYPPVGAFTRHSRRMIAVAKKPKN